ncbi:mitoguardin [Trichonephila clavipes]|nr:mitoguardin [Trichonephila clavipes]
MQGHGTIPVRMKEDIEDVSSELGVKGICLDAEEGKFTHMLEKILEKAYRLQESCSQLFLDSNSVLFKSETQSVISSRHERITEPERKTVTSMSSIESFVSAQAEVTYFVFILIDD